MIGTATVAGVVGVGVDAVDVDRFRQVLARRPGFAARFFTDIEQADAHRSSDPAESLAARFAAKEAVMKALGTGLGGFALTEVEVRKSSGTTATRNAPYLVLHGAATALAEQHGVSRFHLSLTHTAQVAIAFVVAEGAAVQPVLSTAEIRAADAAALEQVSHETLVARAGTAVAVEALRIMGGSYGRRVTVIAGQGSNGADGRVAAQALSRRGVRVTVLGATDHPGTLPPCDLVIDGAYGTGFHGSYEAPTVAPGTQVLAIDLPSGLDADSGAACPGATQATHTVTFAAYKPGLLQGDGPRLCGHVTVVDIGIDTGRPNAYLMEDLDVASLLPPRPRQSHKWTTALGIAAGSPGMEGSAVLCARGAMAAGAGMIRLGTPGDPSGNWPLEAVRIALPGQRWSDDFLDATAKCRALVIGPGLGTGEATREEIRAAVAAAPVPLVIDADGLTALGDLDSAREVLSRRTAPTVLTPHDGEYARLVGSAPSQDRLAAARHLAGALGVIALLKGPLTAVAAPSAPPSDLPDVLLSSAGVPALATAGTGDVLSGIIGAFLARGVDPQQAAALAAHVHGRAAGRGRREGLVAGDLPKLVADFLAGTASHG